MSLRDGELPKPFRTPAKIARDGGHKEKPVRLIRECTGDDTLAE